MVINGQGRELSAQSSYLIPTSLIITFSFASTIFFIHGTTALVVGGLEIANNDVPHSVGLLWTSDRPVAEPSIPQASVRRTTP